MSEQVDVDVRHFTWLRNESETARHQVVVRVNGTDRIEVSVSPSGRSVRVFKDGIEMIVEDQ